MLAAVMETAHDDRLETSELGSAGTFQGPEPAVAPAGGTFHAGVTIDQAAVALRVSPSTARRWVKEGRLRSQRVSTPQGHAFRVFLDRGSEGVEPSTSDGSVSADGDRSKGVSEGSTATSTALSVERSEAMAAYNTALLAPLVAEIAASRQTIERQSAQLIDQAETIGRQAAELEAARDRITALEASHSPGASNPAAETSAPTSEPPPVSDPFPEPLPPTPNGSPWWRRWLGALYG
jgi:excisionase family DNA binding protein